MSDAQRAAPALKTQRPATGSSNDIALQQQIAALHEQLATLTSRMDETYQVVTRTEDKIDTQTELLHAEFGQLRRLIVANNSQSWTVKGLFLILLLMLILNLIL